MTFFFNNVHSGSLGKNGLNRALKFKPLLVLLFTAALGISGCSETTSSVEGPQELIEKKTTNSGFSADAPEEELLSEGKRLYESGLYSVAKEAFESLRDGYPNGAYLEFAEIKVSDSLFESGEYELAKQGFEEFVRNRPISTEASYALFRAGRASEELFTGIGRDPTPIKQAKEIFERVAKEYPDSPYANEARKKISSIEGKLRSYESEVAAYYRRHERDSAAQKREAIATAPLPKVEMGSSDSPQIVAVNRVKETETSKASVAAQNIATEKPVSESSITRIVCDESGRRIFVYLRSPVDSLELDMIRNGESISLPIPNAGTDKRLQSCLGVDNFSVSNGTATWNGVRDGIVMALQNPSRIMIQAKD